MNIKYKYVLIIPFKQICTWNNPLGQNDESTQASFYLNIFLI